MNRAQKGLLNGVAVYFVGNALVALLQLVMLRFITGNVQPDGYGYYNMVVTIDNLVTPILTLQISDAVFRYVIDADAQQKKAAFTNGVAVISAGIAITAIGVVLVSTCFITIEYPVLVILYIVSTNVFALYQKMARAVGANLQYVKSNLLKAFLYVVLQMLFIYGFDLQVESLFLATTLSTFLTVLMLEITVKCRNYLDKRALSITFLKKMLVFSIPFIPNTMLWWLSGSVNSLIITAKLGVESNGIYTIAGKFANVLSMVSGVFNLAWQESAIKEYGKAGSEKFYNQIFRYYTEFLCVCMMLLIPAIYIMMPHMIAPEYYEALAYAPILVLATGVGALYGFLGQLYAATEKTKGIFFSTMWGVVVNVLVVLVGINRFGLYAPSVATALSSTMILWMRWQDQCKSVGMTIPKNVGLLLIGLAISLINYFVGTFWSNLLYGAAIVVLVSVIKRELFKKVLRKTLKLIQQKQ